MTRRLPLLLGRQESGSIGGLGPADVGVTAAPFPCFPAIAVGPDGAALAVDLGLESREQPEPNPGPIVDGVAALAGRAREERELP